MYSHLSQGTIYRWFHVAYRRVPEWALTHLAEVDRHRRSFVAVVGDKIVCHAVYARSEDGLRRPVGLAVPTGLWVGEWRFGG